jgi:nucleotide-binding universal stress UspA family protein
MDYQKILIALDNGSPAVKAAKAGLSLAQKVNAEVALVYVLDSILMMGNIDANVTPKEAKILVMKVAQGVLDEIETHVEGKIKIHRFMPEGKPTEEILNIAYNWGADLIVAGTHGHTGLQHLLTSVKLSII